MSIKTTPRLTTGQSARYLTANYRSVSVSLLRKMRLRKSGDPLDNGPAWERGPDGACYYKLSALNEWGEEWLLRLSPRKAEIQPRHLRSGT